MPGAREFKVSTEFITLGQLLKAIDMASSGGEAKAILREVEILVNGEKEDKRGRKLRPGDLVEIAEGPTVSIV